MSLMVVGVAVHFIPGQTDLASNNMFHTYFLLKHGTDAKKLGSKIPGIY